MNILSKKFLLAAPVAALLVISQQAWSIDSTENYYNIYGTSPQLWLNGSTDWYLANNSFLGGPPLNAFAISQTFGSSLRVPFVIESAAPTNLLYLDSASGAGRVGINTNVPAEDLEILGTTPAIRLNDSSSSAYYANIELSGYEFRIEGNTGQDIFEMDTRAPARSINIDSAGNIGLGTASPAAKLEVTGSGTAKIFVEDISGTTAKRTLFELENNGQVNFAMIDTSLPTADERWDFFLASSGFNMNKFGSGGPELLLGSGGNVKMGNKNGGAGGYNPTFVLDDQGNLAIDGSLSQGSDRNEKQDIVLVDSVSVLETVAKLPISTWEYKGQDGVKHLGPMAQDFHAAFGLGNTTTGISSIDTGGVALAAIKGLNQNLNEIVQIKDQEIAAQDEKISAQKQEIESLKKGNQELSERLTRLEAQQERLSQLEELLRDLTVKGEVAQR